MKVLFVIHGPRDPLTAIFRDVRQRADDLQQRGEIADVLTPNDFPGLRRIPSRLWPLVYPFFVALRLWDQRAVYDLVQFHSYSGWVFHALCRFTKKRPHTLTAFQGLEPIYYRNLKAQAGRSRKRLSWRFRLFYGLLMPQILRASCRSSDRVICLNQAELRYLEKNRWASKAHIVLGENTVSDDFFIEREWRAAASRLMFLGQWLEMKGTRFLVEAFTQLARAHSELELWCVGTLADEETVLASFPEDVRRRVIVRSRVERNELIECFRQADIFVLPSLSEGFSHALMEAMATGLPIVTTPVGAAPDILKDGESALFAPAADANALAQSLSTLLHDAGLRKKLGCRAQIAARYYNDEQSFARFYQLLESILAEWS